MLEFRDNYNRHLQMKKLGFMMPLEARQRYEKSACDQSGIMKKPCSDNLCGYCEPTS
ncbi:MAG: hypothetical protein ABFD46_12910 [Armatimonadota bacterium]